VRDARYYPGTNTALPDTSLVRRYQYTFDVAGNRTAYQDGALPAVTYTYDAANRLDKKNGVSTYFYDAAGRMTDDGPNTLIWDRANRLLSPGNNDVNTFNGLGHRISFFAADGIDYLSDTQPGLHQLIRETRGTDVTRFIHGPTGVTQQHLPNGSWTWLLADGLGSVRGAVNAAGNMTASREYRPHGEFHNGSGVYYPPFGFAGEPTDDYQFIYLRARFYHPALGVFPSLDPLEGDMARAMSLNRYGYVEGNVVNATDPTGMIAERPETWGGCGTPPMDQQTTGTQCEQFIEQLRWVINSALSQLGCAPKPLNEYDECSKANSRDVMLILSMLYSKVRFDPVKILGIFPTTSVIPREDSIDVERWPLERVSGFGPNSANPMYYRNNSSGRQFRDTYGFKRTFFQNTHHFFAYFGLAAATNGIVAKLRDKDREEANLREKARGYCNYLKGTGDPSTHILLPDYQLWYEDAVIDVHVSSLAADLSETIRLNLAYDVRHLPDLLKTRACAINEPNVWSDFDSLLNSPDNPFRNYSPTYIGDGSGKPCDDILG
jgi:RHS repeat-associated protein